MRGRSQCPWETCEVLHFRVFTSLLFHAHGPLLTLRSADPLDPLLPFSASALSASCSATDVAAGADEAVIPDITHTKFFESASLFALGFG